MWLGLLRSWINIAIFLLEIGEIRQSANIFFFIKHLLIFNNAKLLMQTLAVVKTLLANA